MSSQSSFIVYPAIDLRSGKVVRLRQGDPDQQTAYFSDPLAVVRAWIDLGVRWMHIINLDGAFDEPGSANYNVIEKISSIVSDRGACIQYGGGLRSLASIKTALELGITRVILGTAAIENPDITLHAIELFGPGQVAVSLDADDGYLRVHGWRKRTPTHAKEFSIKLYEQGVRWVIFTDISRDGTGRGINISATVELAEATGLNVIASGGVHSTQDISAAREVGLPGIIVGRAIYEGSISIQECLQFMAYEE
jgi:phosphoribosylformimino-5-aminoimidazole carboxamide ribotide isomerase